jgi:hypothetical protein
MNGRTYARGTHRVAVPEVDKLSFHGKDELVAGHARAACTPHESLDRETVPSWSANWRAASGSMYPMLVPTVFGRPSAPDASVVMASVPAVAPGASTLGSRHAAARVRERRRARAHADPRVARSAHPCRTRGADAPDSCGCALVVGRERQWESGWSYLAISNAKGVRGYSGSECFVHAARHLGELVRAGSLFHAQLGDFRSSYA